jgi:hypothetical protein
VVAELLFVTLAFPVAIVDATDRSVAPVDDANPFVGAQIRAGTDEYVAPPHGGLGRAADRACHVFFEPEVPEVRALAIDRAADATAPLGTERPEIVHLLEERRQVFGVGHRNELAKLEHSVFVEHSAARRRNVGSRGRGERSLHGRQKAQLLAHDPRGFRVVLQAGHLAGRTVRE